LGKIEIKISEENVRMAPIVNNTPMQPIKPIELKSVSFGNLTKKEDIKLTTKSPETTEVKDMHQISLKAAEQSFENKGFPVALAAFTMQDKALMPSKPALTAIVGNKLQETFGKKEEPKSSFEEGAEVEQYALVS
jgi:hypothetical protein